MRSGVLLLLTVLLAAPAPKWAFSDVTEAAGVRFRHVNGATAEKYVVETMGSGAALFDYDNDGRLDVLLVGGGRPPGATPSRHGLFRNRGDGTVEDKTAASGLTPGGRFGMGAAAADYDNDGWTDLYLTAFGGNTLWRNRGDGTFEDVTERAGVTTGGWSSSAAWLDYDRDGDLDLFVARYVDYRYSANRVCMEGSVRAYCHPDIYDGTVSLLYHNNGDGTFADVSDSTGIAGAVGKGLGVAAADLDGDGWTDLYVANDSVANFLFLNRGGESFREEGLLSGAAFDEAGRPQAGMGVAVGDANGDGRLDLVVTNLDHENNNLYLGGDGYYSDRAAVAGVMAASLGRVGWGIGLVDLDSDGDLDQFVVNGHVIDNVELIRPATSYRQAPLLLENRQGRFDDVTAAAGPDLARPRAARGAAFGDIDNDGDIDVLVATVGGPPALLRNDSGQGNALLLELVGTASPRTPFGSEIRAAVRGRELLRVLAGGGSYLSSSDPRIHLGLGTADRADDVRVRWSSGAAEEIGDLAAGFLYTVTEGRGITGRRPLSR